MYGGIAVLVKIKMKMEQQQKMKGVKVPSHIVLHRTRTLFSLTRPDL